MEKLYVIIWKDKKGNIHRTEHLLEGGLGYLLWFYNSWPIIWYDYKLQMPIEKPEKELLYLFKQKECKS